jgi:hypothetical protein
MTNLRAILPTGVAVLGFRSSCHELDVNFLISGPTGPAIPKTCNLRAIIRSRVPPNVNVTGHPPKYANIMLEGPLPGGVGCKRRRPNGMHHYPHSGEK